MSVNTMCHATLPVAPGERAAARFNKPGKARQGKGRGGGENCHLLLDRLAGVLRVPQGCAIGEATHKTLSSWGAIG